MSPPMRCLLCAAVLSASVAVRAADPAGVTVTPLDDRVRIEIGGALFTEYIFRGAPRPYCHPVLAPDGMPLTRDYPQKETPGEDRDHVHHRSLWFAHGAVNGVDFWTEGPARGRIEHAAVLEATSGATGVLRTRNRWLAPDGRVVCTDETTLRVRAAPSGTLLDWEVTFQAPADRPLLLGDTKEGTMAVRVAQWLTMPHRMAGKEIPGVGRILTSRGARDNAAWGTTAEWCDYHAARDGRTYGVAIFDHPANFRPTWWMVRDYGLFAANPFGRHEFENRKDEPHLGDHTIAAGGVLTLRYRFYFHLGDPETARVADAYHDYAAGR